MIEAHHIRFESENVLSAKKDLLSTEMNVLESIKRLRNYKLLKKKELSNRIKFIVRLKSIKSDIGLINAHLPHDKHDSNQEIHKKTKHKEDLSHSHDIQEQLLDIKKQLALLER